MNSIHKLYSESHDSVNSILYNGKLITGGGGRGFKTAIEFNNDSSLNENEKSFADINSDSFSSNELSVAFWIHPKNQSFQNSTIFANETNGKTTGIFYNCGDTNEGHIGINWNDDITSPPLKLNLNIKNTGWAHFVFVFEKEGVVRVFGNGKYLLKHDFGRGLEKVKFSNMRMGGFSGWLDDLQIYHFPLKYGKVNINELATQNISYIFNTSRKTGELSIPLDIDAIEMNQPFYYIQDTDFVEAHTNYNLEKQNNQNYFSDDSNHITIGGVNDGKPRLASGSFRTFLGKIYDQPLEEGK
tara:strand:- start:859 stop:1755 length:897 start_codon:yes stop_codon:yes gene_type:complete